MDFSMGIQKTSVERMKASEAAIMTTLIMSPMIIAICPMTILNKVPLHVHIQDHILQRRGIYSFPQTFVIIACGSHHLQDNLLTTAGVSTTRITLSRCKPQV
jgi:hypothetical protein